MVDYHHYLRKFDKSLRVVRIFTKDEHGKIKFIEAAPEKFRSSHSEEKMIDSASAQRKKSFHGFLSQGINPDQVVHELENVFYGRKNFNEISPESIAHRIRFDLEIGKDAIKKENLSMEDLIKELTAEQKPLRVKDSLDYVKSRSLLRDFSRAILEALYDENSLDLLVDLQIKLKDRKLKEFLIERSNDVFGDDPIDYLYHNLAMIRILRKITKIAQPDLELNYDEILPDRNKLEFLGAIALGDDVRGWNLESRTDLSKTYFAGIDFRNVDFRGADLTNCIFENCNFQGANLSGCTMDGAEISFSNFRNAAINNVNISKKPVFIVFSDFSRAELNGTSFKNCILFGNKMRMIKTNQSTDFSRSNLQQCDLTKTKLSPDQIFDANLTGAKMKSLDE